MGKWDDLQAREQIIRRQLEETEDKRREVKTFVDNLTDYDRQAYQNNLDLGHFFYETPYTYLVDESYDRTNRQVRRIDEHYEQVIQDYRKEERQIEDQLDRIAIQKRQALLDEEK